MYDRASQSIHIAIEARSENPKQMLANLAHRNMVYTPSLLPHLKTHACTRTHPQKAFRRLKEGKCTSSEKTEQLEQLTNDLMEQGSQALNLPALVDPNYIFAYRTRASNLFL